MISSSIHIRCLLLFFILLQSVSLYKIYADDQQHPDSKDSSFKDETNSLIQYESFEDEDNIADNWQLKSKRSISSNRLRQTPQRHNSRPHWNPLVAAYKRCGELTSRIERESCFKEAVQMLFVYKLRK
ncbi:unnamed protein product [Adineta ricciae]|uniref:Uncharacterized protein n=1 Tax=Adineta ricciae TaxID=249248 RepID=A0A813TJ22_ADIRI|nr:unnamed protein product [Adineta ricciae]CAF0871575.1 unnamed protein product [Adineta ricciae]